jgi:YggT family protein
MWGRRFAHLEREVNIASAKFRRYLRAARIFSRQTMISAIFWLAGELIHLMILAIIAAAVMSILIAFGVANPRNQIVYSVADFLNKLTEPVLRPIRRFLPYLGNVDVSPVVAILLLQALQMVLADIYGRLAMAGMAF